MPKRRRTAGYCESFRLGDVSVPAEMASIAARRANEHWKRGFAVDYALRTTLAAIYMQGLNDAADVLLESSNAD